MFCVGDLAVVLPAMPLIVASLSGVAWSTLSKSKLEIFCGLPFSRMVKSFWLSPRTTSPVFLSRTTTLVRTRSLLTFRVKEPLLGWELGGGGPSGGPWARRLAVDNAATKANNTMLTPALNPRAETHVQKAGHWAPASVRIGRRALVMARNCTGRGR